MTQKSGCEPEHMEADVQDVWSWEQQLRGTNRTASGWTVQTEGCWQECPSRNRTLGVPLYPWFQLTHHLQPMPPVSVRVRMRDSGEDRSVCVLRDGAPSPQTSPELRMSPAPWPPCAPRSDHMGVSAAANQTRAVELREHGSQLPIIRPQA